jgi:hypothetical protein
LLVSTPPPAKTVERRKEEGGRTDGHVEAAVLELAVLLAERAWLAEPVDAAVGAWLLLEAVVAAQPGAVAAGVEAAHPGQRGQRQV